MDKNEPGRAITEKFPLTPVEANAMFVLKWIAGYTWPIFLTFQPYLLFVAYLLTGAIGATVTMQAVILTLPLKFLGIELDSVKPAAEIAGKYVVLLTPFAGFLGYLLGSLLAVSHGFLLPSTTLKRYKKYVRGSCILSLSCFVVYAMIEERSLADYKVWTFLGGLSGLATGVALTTAILKDAKPQYRDTGWFLILFVGASTAAMAVAMACGFYLGQLQQDMFMGLFYVPSAVGVVYGFLTLPFAFLIRSQIDRNVIPVS